MSFRSFIKLKQPVFIRLCKIYDPSVSTWTVRPLLQPSVILNYNNYETIIRSISYSSIYKSDKPPPGQPESQLNSVIKVVHKPKDRQKLDVTQVSTERNFITPVRAMNEYILKPDNLNDLRKFQRRSPYEEAPPLTVYLRRDVEARALQVWGSWEVLQREIKKRKLLEESYRDSILQVKKVLRDYNKMNDPQAKLREELLKQSNRVVLSAVCINFANFIFKGAASFCTGSHSLFAESIHSLADTFNQCILAYGIKKSIQEPNEEHPYGYHSFRYIASLISGVGIFCVGSGLSIYHGINGLMHPQEIESLYWAYLVLGGSLLSEGGTLMIAFSAIRQGAKRSGSTLKEYIMRAEDPTVNVVLLEDAAAVVGVTVAATFMGLTSYFNTPIYDAVGSLIVGGLLGVVASFIIYTNSGALVGRSIPTRKLENMNKCLEDDVMVRAIHDVKATDLGNSVIRYKAEVDIDGRQLTRHYLDTIDLEVTLEEMQNVKSIEDVEAFMLKHGENTVDLLGAEVDRIERALKKQYPQLRHVDLEVL